MFLRAILAFLALPGMVAIMVPVIWLRGVSNATLTHPLGLMPLAAGFLGLLWCIRDFYVSGKGTLAPWAPPTCLVVVGFYRFTRNPMYVSVTTMLLGWAASFANLGLFIYAVCVACAFHLRVTLYEEPWLARAHGEAWQRYAIRVPRWLW